LLGVRVYARFLKTKDQKSKAKGQRPTDKYWLTRNKLVKIPCSKITSGEASYGKDGQACITRSVVRHEFVAGPGAVCR
jgi:hypothetical protein